MAQNEYAVRLEHVTKTFGTVVANKDVSLGVRRGEILALLGENGSGKTTLMNMIAGIYFPDEGEIYVGDEAVTIRSPRDALDLGIGMIHQHFKLVDVFSATENIALSMGGKDKFDLKRVHDKARAICEKYEFNLDLNQKVYEMSVSQKQTLEIVKVLYRGADILILDEPTAGLDPRGREEILQEIQAYRNQTGATILLVSHSMEDVARHAKKILVMNAGKVFCYDTVANVFRRSQELQAIGLAVPQITRVCDALRARGVPLTDDIFTVEQAKQQLLEWYHRTRGGQGTC